MCVAAIARRPTGDVVEVGQHLGIRHLADQPAQERLDIGEIIRIALAKVELRRNGEVTFQRQTAADIADMFMYAENFLHYDDDRQRAIGIFGAGMKRRHTVALRGNGGFARD